jgi:hypothetical protein
MVAATGAGAATKLGLEKTQFTVNGKPTFLLGISYYGALGAPKEFVLADLDDMQKCGFNWMRVWATWAAFGNDASAVDGEGNPRKAQLSELQWLVEECDRRGIIVDVTLSRGNGLVGPPRLKSPETSNRAVKNIVAALKPYRNWYLDLANERNIKDERFVSFDELVEMRKLVRSLDAERLVTASHAGDITLDDLRQYLIDVGVDFISPHRPRDAHSPGQTANQTKNYMQRMKELGRIVPVHYQEPFRRGFSPDDFEPKAEDFLTDLKQAKTSGAAGWCFHNGGQKDKPDSKPRRSFDMREKRLFEQLDEEEKKFVEKMKDVLGK